MGGAPGTGGKNEGAELIVSLALLLISGFFAYHSLIMERPEGWETAPGLMPLFLSASLFVMSGIIFIASLKKGGLKALLGSLNIDQSDERKTGFLKSSGRGLIAMAAVGIFYFILLRFLPFEIAAVIFFLVMTQVYWSDASLTKRIVVSVCLPVIIAVVFQGGFGIPLPGEGNLIEIIVYNLRH